MNSKQDAPWGAAILSVAPAVLLFGFAYHPWIGSPVDAGFYDRLASAVIAEPNRWAVAHLAVGVGSALLAVAFVALRNWLREAGENLWSRRGLPLVIVGSTFFAMLPAMEFAPLAVARSGGDVAATQAAMMPWFAPVLFTGATVFFLGAVGFSIGIVRGRILGRSATRVAVGALLVMAASRFVPLGLVQLYLQGLAGVIAFWPLAYRLWKRPPGIHRSNPAASSTAAATPNRVSATFAE